MKKLGEGGLMGRVSWSTQAEADLDSVDPAVADQLRRNAEQILHDIPPNTAHSADEGACAGIMWHRGIGHGWSAEEDNEPQNYFFLYRKWNPALGFEILAVRSIHQIASMWVQMTREPRDTYDVQSL
jgi:hypothetical protein